MAKKRKAKTTQLRAELKEAYDMFLDMQELMENCLDDKDAVALEDTAHRLQGMGSQLSKVEDLAGALALAIDPDVENKV